MEHRLRLAAIIGCFALTLVALVASIDFTDRSSFPASVTSDYGYGYGKSGEISLTVNQALDLLFAWLSPQNYQLTNLSEKLASRIPFGKPPKEKPPEAPPGEDPYTFGPFALICTALPSNAVSWWRFDETSGITAADSVDSNPGTLTNGPVFAAGKVNNGLSLDGVNDYVNMGDPASGNLDFGSGDFTVDVWVKLTNGASLYDTLFSKFTSGLVGYGMIMYSNGTLYGVIGDGVNLHDFTTTATVDDNAWHHIAMVRGSNDVIPYIDGVAVSYTHANSATVGNISNATAFTVGAKYKDVNDYFASGLMDEVEVFNRALTSSEILALFNAGSAGKCKSCTAEPSGMISWWPGDVNASDYKGTNNGTLKNGATLAAAQVSKGFSLDGVNDYVEAPDSNNLDLTGALTVDFWIKSSQTDTNTVVMEKGSNANLMFQPASSGSGLFYFDGGTTAPEATRDLIFNNQFHHVAFTFDGSVKRLYVDGVEQHSAGASSQTANASSLHMGSRAGTFAFSGLMDEVEIFNRALTSTEILAIYSAGSNGKCKPACVAQPSNMVSWWPMDETSGGTAADIKDGNSGTVTGATFTDGKVSNALNFTGATNYVEKINPTNLNVASNISIDMWIKATSFTTRSTMAVLAKRVAAPSAYELSFSSSTPGKLNFLTKGGSSPPSDCSSTASLSSGVWNHIAATFDGASKKIYFNGVLDTNCSSASGTLHTGTGNLYIGNRGTGSEAFDGKIDEVEIFTTAVLSSSDILNIYNAGATGKCKGTCGNSTVDSGEQCDPAATSSSQCPFSARTCSSTCQCVTQCGNGSIETGETCDDSNTANGDGCSSTCTIEAGFTCTGEPSVCTVAGSVSITSPVSATFTSVPVSTTSQNTTATVTGVNIIDTRGGSPGWTGTMKMTNQTIVGTARKTAGANDTVTSSGTYDGTFGVSDPVKKYIITITAGGAVGVATFDVSGAETQAGLITGANVAIGTKGVKATFATATYVIGDKWEIAIDVQPYTSTTLAPGSITANSGTLTGVTAGAGGTFTGAGVTSAALTVMSATVGNGTGNYSQNEALTLSAHANSLVGNYTGTATFTVV